MIRIEIPGPPVAKGRPRIGMIGGKARAFTPPKTVAYEALIAMAGQAAMDGRGPLAGAVRLEVVAWFAIPPSWSKRRKAEAQFHTSRPDGDNILKAVGDGLNGICWNDDSQIAEASIAKRYGAQPCVAVTVSEL